MCLRQVLAVGAGPLEKIRHGVQPEPVDAEIEPEVDYFENRLSHVRAVVIEIGLMRVKAMPKVCFRNRVPGPVGGLEVLEDYARVLVLVGRVAPHIEVAPTAAGR